MPLHMCSSMARASCGAAWQAIKPWLPATYAFVMMLGLPALVYGLVAPADLQVAYYVVSAMFAFVAAWVLLETLMSLVATVAHLATANLHMGFDPGRKWPEVTYMIPAYLNNEVSSCTLTC